MIPPRLDSPAVEPDVLHRRLDHIRQALGARTLGLARRLTLGSGDAVSPFEILGRVDVRGNGLPSDGSPGLPVEVIHRLMVGTGVLDWRRDVSETPAPTILERWGGRRIRGWALPDDRRSSIYAVAIWGDGPDPGPRREETARLGLEALARALAPPDWLPLRNPSPGAGPTCPPLPLVGSSALAVRVRRSYERLRDSPGPVLVVGPTERGTLQLAAGLLGVERVGRVGSIENLGSDVVEETVFDGSPLPRLEAPVQERVYRHLQDAVRRRRRFVFLCGEGLREEVRQGRVRADLYWTLASRQLWMPPLAMRRADLPDLVREAWRRHGGGRIELSPKVTAVIRDAAWPGDFAQLEAEIRRLVCEHPGAHRLQRRWFRRQLLLPLESAVPETATLDEAVAEVERRLLRRAMQVARGNKAQAARMLRVSRTGLYRKLRAHGLLAPTRPRGGDEMAEPR